MSQTLIEQNPLYDTFPVGQDVIFTVSNSSVVSTFTKVKFIAEVHISSVLPPNVSTSDDLVGTFKTTPNNAGVGMFDFRPIIESFVKADNLAREGSAYKTVVNTSDSNVPIHLIDKYSGNLNIMRYLAIQFKVEYIDLLGDFQTGQAVNSDIYRVFNGYLKYTDVQDINASGNFGFNTGIFQLGGGASGNQFLSNAPLTQYANINDYGTVSFMATPLSGSVATTIDHFNITLVNTSGGSSVITIDNLDANGGNTTWNAATYNQLLHLGCFPANLKNWSSAFLAAIPTLDYYFVQAFNASNSSMSDRITISINCPTLKGYEPIRLCWLNQWGAWDYYTFTQKSTKMISTKGSTYQQLEGTWNKSTYKIDSFKGGKKAFRVNATEKIKMNTDFVSESESEWFEELINSPEVYILEGFQTDASNSALNKYVTPVRLTTSSYTKKTVANDKLMQYTFEVEKSKTLRTQSV